MTENTTQGTFPTFIQADKFDVPNLPRQAVDPKRCWQMSFWRLY